MTGAHKNDQSAWIDELPWRRLVAALGLREATGRGRYRAWEDFVSQPALLAMNATGASRAA